ncbi:penicillin acylase family protein [Nocardioides sp. R-C-SC26]|uniref:penicillin acylase family protein n=1 Tax=Nocardioides sp. R-C-SC26 TaxID=2870414 RepID=UPI001E36CE03|nr:penicillin acylase family protein [Nocardioides sp. R-C-SC26]
MARLYRDAYGVPHLRATSLADLAYGQGRVVATDRTWQLEYLRRRASGTTAELLGASGLGWDRFARRTCVVETAQRAFDGLSQEAQGFVAAYVDGVNAAVADGVTAAELRELGASAQRWQPWMPLAVFQALHLTFAGLGSALWSRWARDVLGDDAALLTHEGADREEPLTSGSNAWGVGGGRTASGRPLIGGDPHRVIEQPGVYLQIRLACEDPDDSFDVLGFTFAGVPGVQHFAHAGDVAWAITNGMADYQDVHRDGEHPADEVIERRRETIAVRDADDVTIEVVRTSRGVVFEPGWTLQDAPTQMGDLGFEALVPLLRARTVDDVDRALDHWVAPVNNAVIADVGGALRYRLAGRVPMRDAGGEWTGWLQCPRHDEPPSGQVVTANDRRGPESDAVGRVFAPPYRADRISALLRDREELTTADFVAVHDDAFLGSVAELVALVPGAFDTFDAQMVAGSTEAGRFAAWRSAFVRRIAEQPVFAPFRDPEHELNGPHRHELLFAPWLDVVSRIAHALPSLVAAGTPFGIDLVSLARDALVEIDADIAATGPRTWGESHVVTPVHAFEVHGRTPPELPRLPVDGDSDCVRCTASYPGQTDECYRGSVARYVWDLADRTAGGWVVPTGSAGDPAAAHHHDQLGAWVAGELVPIVTDWNALQEVPGWR